MLYELYKWLNQVILNNNISITPTTSLRDVSSIWFFFEKKIIPLFSSISSITYFLFIVWIMFTGIINGLYIVIPGFRDILDTFYIGKFLIAEDIKEDLIKADDNSVKVFVKHILLKHGLLWLSVECIYLFVKIILGL